MQDRPDELPSLAAPVPARLGAPLHYGWVVLGLIVLAVFGSLGLARFGYTSILPAMQEALQLSNTQTGELQSWNLVGYLVTVVFAGVLATKFGPRRVIAVALVVTAAGMIVTGLLATFPGARLGRFLAGVGGAGGNVPAMALVSSWFAAKRRGLAAGIGVAGSSLALMVMGPLIPSILEGDRVSGWRVCWYVLGAMTLAVSVLCALGLRNRPAAMGLTPIGETEAEGARRIIEQSASSLDWALVWRSRILWHLALVYFAFGFSYIIYSTFFIRYLSKEGGLTQAQAGWLWSQIGVVSGVSALIWGSISDRWGRRVALVGVFVLQGASFLALGLSCKLPVVYASVALFGLTAWSIPALMAALAGDVFGGRLAPAALGLMTIVFGAGQALGPYVAGRMADAAGSFGPAFVTAGITALLLGGGGSFVLRMRHTVAADASAQAGSPPRTLS